MWVRHTPITKKRKKANLKEIGKKKKQKILPITNESKCQISRGHFFFFFLKSTQSWIRPLTKPTIAFIYLLLDMIIFTTRKIMEHSQIT